MTLILTLDQQTLRDAITLTTPCAATDNGRPVLTGINFRSKPDNVAAVSGADGFRLSVFNADGVQVEVQDGDDKPEFNFTIEANAAKGLITKIERNNSRAHIIYDRLNPGHVDLRWWRRGQHVSEQVPVVQGNYPGYDSLIGSRDNSHEVVVNSGDLLHALKVATGAVSGAVSGNNRYKPVVTRIYLREKRLLLISSYDEGAYGVVSVNADFKVEGIAQENEFRSEHPGSFDARHLLGFAKAIYAVYKDASVNLRFAGRSNGVEIAWNDQRHKSLLQPLFLGNLYRLDDLLAHIAGGPKPKSAED